MTEQEAQEKLQWITDRIVKYKKETLDNYICIAGAFNDLKTSSLYMCIRTKNGNLGYDNVYDLIKEQYGYSKSTVNNYIGVANRFGERFSVIKPEYKDYDFSQLVEMLALDNKQLPKVSPDMTCAEIRKLKTVDKPQKVTEFTPTPNTQLLINFSQDIFDKIISNAKKQKISPVEFVYQSIKFYIESVLID
jgi:hypothetical protein